MASDPQFPSNFDLGTLLRQGATGAAAGAPFGPVGAAIGGVAGAGLGALSDLFGPNPTDVYNELMKKYTSSPEYAAQQDALSKLKDQTVDGPTAQEKSALDLALRTANEQAAAQTGGIQNQLRSTQGVGSGVQAALLAAKGQGDSTRMSSGAIQAAGQEAARKDSGIRAYATATQAAQKMQDDYRKWASGEALGQQQQGENRNNANIAAITGAAGSIAKFGSDNGWFKGTEHPGATPGAGEVGSGRAPSFGLYDPSVHSGTGPMAGQGNGIVPNADAGGIWTPPPASAPKSAVQDFLNSPPGSLDGSPVKSSLYPKVAQQKDGSYR